MSIFGRISTVVALVAAMVMVSFTAQAAAPGATPGSATVVKIEGDILNGATVDGKPLTVGRTVGVNSVIATREGTSVTLNLGSDVGIVMVRSGSTVSIDKLEVGTDAKGKPARQTELNVKTGGVSGNIKKLNASSKFQVKTSQGIAGIRGTNFTTYSDGSTSVFDGTVEVVFIINGVASKPVTVQAGQTVTPPTTPGGDPIVIATPPDAIPGVPVSGGQGEGQLTVTVILPAPSAQIGIEGEQETHQDYYYYYNNNTSLRD